MDIKIKSKSENRLMARTEIAVDVGFERATPSRQEVRAALAASLKVPEDAVAVLSIGTGFGDRKAAVEAHVYKDRETLERAESGVIRRRNSPAKKE